MSSDVAMSAVADDESDSDLPDLKSQPVNDARPELVRTISNIPIGRTQYE